MLKYIKLRNGEDLIANTTIQANGVKLIDPIIFDIDPVNGIFAKEWIMYSANGEITIDQSDIFFITEVNQTGIDLYTEFMHSHSTKPNQIDSDLESIYNALLESRNSTKH